MDTITRLLQKFNLIRRDKYGMPIWTHKENVQMWKASVAYILVVRGGYDKNEALDIAIAEYDKLLTNMKSVDIVQYISTYDHAVSYLEKHHPFEDIPQPTLIEESSQYA